MVRVFCGEVHDLEPESTYETGYLGTGFLLWKRP